MKAGQRFVDSFFGGRTAAWVYPLITALCLSVGAVVGAVLFVNVELTAVYPLAGFVVLLAIGNQVVREGRRRRGLPL